MLSKEERSDLTGTKDSGLEWSTYSLADSALPDSQRIQIDAGDFVIQKNLASYASDPRIHSEKMLNYLESN